MKSNKGLYILLPVVFIVWGLIIYRIVKYAGEGNSNVALPVPTELKFEPEKFRIDTFSIVADYRDPFLGEQKIEKKISTALKAPNPILKSPIKNELPWPSVSFHGLIKNKDSKNTYALLTVNGKMKSFSDKDEWQGLRILSIARDSIILTYKKQKKSFKKK